jgi:hypothetical protein
MNEELKKNYKPFHGNFCTFFAHNLVRAFRFPLPEGIATPSLPNTTSSRKSVEGCILFFICPWKKIIKPQTFKLKALLLTTSTSQFFSLKR